MVMYDSNSYYKLKVAKNASKLVEKLREFRNRIRAEKIFVPISDYDKIDEMDDNYTLSKLEEQKGDDDNGVCAKLREGDSPKVPKKPNASSRYFRH